MTEPTRTMKDHSGRQETDFWIRSYWIWSLIYLGSLGVPTIIALFNSEIELQTRLLAVGLAVLSAVWHWFWAYFLLRGIGFPQDRPLLMSVYIIGIFGIWYFLVGINDVFYIHLAGAYSQIFIFLFLV